MSILTLCGRRVKRKVCAVRPVVKACRAKAAIRAAVERNLDERELTGTVLPLAGSAEHLRRHVAEGGTSGKRSDPYTAAEMGLI